MSEFTDKLMKRNVHAGYPLKLLLARLKNAGRGLSEARAIIAARPSGCVVPDSACWFLENYYILDQRLRKLAESLKVELARTRALPAVRQPDIAWIPRIEEMVHANSLHSDGRITPELLIGEITEFDEVTPLQLAETRVFPLIAQLVVLEYILQEVRGIIGGADGNRGLAMRNFVHSLRTIGALDWKMLSCEASAIDRILRDDPAKVYGRMELESKLLYADEIERIARRSGKSDREIAARCLTLSREAAAAEGTEADAAHVGYFLIGRGKPVMEEGLSFSTIFRRSFDGFFFHRNVFFYHGSIVVLTLVFAWWALRGQGLPWGLLVFFGLFTLIAVSQTAISVVNWMAAFLQRPRLLPRIDYSNGIDDRHRTLVVVPAMLGSAEDARRLVRDLESRYLGNRQDNLLYALLTDFRDARHEAEPMDDQLLDEAKAGIEALNIKYAVHGDIFHLFHRPRIWNAGEGVWMGRERKRGKLEDLNRAICRQDLSGFAYISGEGMLLGSIRYVITLDEDTLLPYGAAWKMTGAMSHPLNRPLFDPEKGRVSDGYGLLQPRVGIPLPQTQGESTYSRMQGNSAGLDHYTKASADLYQDLFGEGSYIGKGIYDVRIYEKALCGKLPENRILSHDLLEGCIMRSGLISDVQLFEEHPTTYLQDIRRHHRWIRGDWQLLGYFIMGARSELSLLSLWKIADNLRRSLVPVSLIAALLLSWIGQVNPLFWSIFIVGLIGFPSLLALLTGLVKAPWPLLRPRLWKNFSLSLLNSLCQSALSVANLPFEAYYTGHAVLSAIWRMTVSHKRLLEWNPSSAASGQSGTRLRRWYAAMWVNPLIGLALVFPLARCGAGIFYGLAPILIIWIAAPLLDWRISRPLGPAEKPVSESDRRFLHLLSRRVWTYFSQFVTGQDNWLPPDYFQEYPAVRISHRTSPTNMGLSLLANLTAFDLGYLSLGQFMERSQKTLSAMGRLERWRGHFYNWYDTHTLQPVRPLYVSTVDSGNLITQLHVFRQGLMECGNERVLRPADFHGLLDLVRLIRDEGGDGPVLREMEAILKPLAEEGCCSNQFALKEALLALAALAKRSDGRAANLQEQVDLLQKELTEFAPWLGLPAPSDRIANYSFFEEIPTLSDLSRMPERQVAANLIAMLPSPDELEMSWMIRFGYLLSLAGKRAAQRLGVLQSLSDGCTGFCNADFGFLYDRGQRLLSIGYSVSNKKRDTGCYDMLASEARAASFLAVSTGQIPQESWFALARPLVKGKSRYYLLSWSGSIFEYLMPQLIMPMYRSTLIDMACRNAVDCQIEFGKSRHGNWGYSECANCELDANLAYQYGPSGLAELGLQHKADQEDVLAPYASAMALMTCPEEACDNLRHLAGQGMLGRYGFYEAQDFTRSRLPGHRPFDIVRTFMTHHQGMTLLSLAFVLLKSPMQRRFCAVPIFRSNLMLLQEMPSLSTAFTRTALQPSAAPDADGGALQMDVREEVDMKYPEVIFLSNGRYQVMATAAGGGYSRWKDIAVTRWREDILADGYGILCYITEQEEDRSWTTTLQYGNTDPDSYAASFLTSRARYSKLAHGIEACTEMVVAVEDDVEIRRVRLVNRSDRPRKLMVTSYVEIVLSPAADELSHPAFSNLFMETKIVKELQSILARRRPKGDGRHVPVAFHCMNVSGTKPGHTAFETDRLRFVGRGHDLGLPMALTGNSGLSGTEGPVLDPIMAIQHEILLSPNGSAELDLVLGLAPDEEACLCQLRKYHDHAHVNTVFDMSIPRGQSMLKRARCSEMEAKLYRRLAACIGAGNAQKVLVNIEEPDGIALIESLVKARNYLGLHGFHPDLVIVNANKGTYRQFLHEQIQDAVGVETGFSAKQGVVALLDAAQTGETEMQAAYRSAALILSAADGDLARQLEVFQRRDEPGGCLGRSGELRATRSDEIAATRSDEIAATGSDEIEETGSDETGEKEPMDRPMLTYFNGIGGFSPEGREYIVLAGNGVKTPMPWSNVLANPTFGTIVTESGHSYSWKENAHEYRLTTWHNDPVRDLPGEVYYIRDNESGLFSTLPPLSSEAGHRYTVRHGFGYSIFEFAMQGLLSKMEVFVDKVLPVKYVLIRLDNQSGRKRDLSVYGYVEWVLGGQRTGPGHGVVTEMDSRQVALAVNGDQAWLPEEWGFFSASEPLHSITCHRPAFLGKSGSFRRPVALTQATLSEESGPGCDPCAALQLSFSLAPGEVKELVFVLGSVQGREAAVHLANTQRQLACAKAAFREVGSFWQEMLSGVEIHTPDPAIDLLVNGWLPYQAVSGRIWGRSGYYQSSGAYGFRDQLQDAVNLLPLAPDLARQQLLLCASKQFAEGDVLHWWQPPGSTGVRSSCSDDYLWLPFGVCQYTRHTGDAEILDEQVSYLEGRQLGKGEHTYFSRFEPGVVKGSLYEHCRLAIEHGLNFGPHGLPLMGAGDWNDSMDQAGIGGRGESVWVAFFLFHVLCQFAELASDYGDSSFAARCLRLAAALQSNIEQHGWDGEWYKRGYFDSGEPIGSAKSEEGRIDSISQSWAILSGAAGSRGLLRGRQAIQAAMNLLVDKEHAIVRILSPAYDKCGPNPGYIKGYVPGARENGGHYTQAAIWLAMAFADSGDAETAYELLRMVNPIHRSDSFRKIGSYKVEPYVVAADIYATTNDAGRGGWTWYTGSAGWMYRMVTGSLLGMTVRGDRLRFQPCLPQAWAEVSLTYRFGATPYHVRLIRTDDESRYPEMDGEVLHTRVLAMKDDGAPHFVNYFFTDWSIAAADFIRDEEIKLPEYD